MKLFYLLSLLLISSTDCSSLQFLRHPIDRVVSPLQSTSIYCNVSGSLTEISWYKGSDPPVQILAGTGTKYSFPSGDGSILKISSFSSADNDVYYCVASNGLGSVRSLNANITVATINSITAPPSMSLTLNANSPTILNCTLPSSTPSASVQWFRGTSPVTLSNRVAVTLSGKLVFSYMLLDDQGPYKCNVMNQLIPGSTATSNQYLLSINSPVVSNPSVSLVNDALPTSQTVTVGMEVHFECFATGRPIPTYSWSKDGSAILSSQKIVFTQSNRILTITNVSLLDAGQYNCTITQGSMQLESTAALTVIDLPRITQSFNNISQLASLSVNVSCTAEGTLPIKWIWRKNAVQLEQSSNVQFNETGAVSTLTINSLDINDSSIVQCVAYSDNYRYMSAANNDLLVQTISPVITVSPNDMFAFVGSSIVLPCEASSYPFPTFTWLRNNAKLSLTNRHYLSKQTFNGTLTISPTVIGDSATYRCTVQSIPGALLKLSNTVVVRVTDIPQIEHSPTNRIAQNNEDVTFDCVISQIPGTEVQADYIWQKEGVLLDTVVDPKFTLYNNGSLLIRNFQPSLDAGKYTCMVTLIAVGTHANSLQFVVGSAFLTSAPPTVPSRPRNLVVSMATHTSILIRWDVPSDNGSLAIKHYIVQTRTVVPFCDSREQSKSNFSWNTSNTSLFVDTLKPSTKYIVQVYAVNSNGTSNASILIQFETKESSPTGPPLLINVSGSVDIGQLLVTWSHPSCQERNGIIVNYTLMVISNTNTWNITTVDNSTNITVHNLPVLTQFNVLVAANTAAGIGPFSEPINATTSLAHSPNPPLNVIVQIINCTVAKLLWNASNPVGDDPVNNLTIPSLYKITHYNMVYNTSSTSFILPDELMEGSNTTVIISAINHFGTSKGLTVNIYTPNCTSISSKPTNNTVTTATTDITKQSWFIYAVSGGGAGIIVLVVIILICCCTCCICCKKCNNSKNDTTPSPNKFHFTYPNRRSTVLDRMMQVEASTPNLVESEYAELDTLVPAVISNNNTDTLTSQSSTLKSKYLYKSPMEQEEDRLKNGVQIETIEDMYVDTLERDHTIPSPVGTSQRRLFATSRNNALRNRPGSVSPTDTVSSFEYESHAQIMQKYSRIQKANRLQSSESKDDQTDGGYKVVTNNKPAATGNNKKLPPTFRKLPDLALMTALPAGNVSSSSSPSYTEKKSPQFVLPSLVREANSQQKHVSHQYPTNEHIYQHPRPVTNKYTYTLPNITTTQMSLV